ncbi:MAG: 30S ribosomal protein S6 [Chloroflexota bacterium]|nr:30S ribosomal protein S6 [Chloroflexota bacterium]
MRNYELTVIFSPAIAEENAAAALDNVNHMITQKGGVVVDVNRWGRRRLAYPIKKFMEGDYVLEQVQMDPETISAVEAEFELSEDIIRYLFIRKDE